MSRWPPGATMRMQLAIAARKSKICSSDPESSTVVNAFSRSGCDLGVQIRHTRRAFVARGVERDNPRRSQCSQQWFGISVSFLEQPGGSRGIAVNPGGVQAGTQPSGRDAEALPTDGGYAFERHAGTTGCQQELRGLCVEAHVGV